MKPEHVTPNDFDQWFERPGTPLAERTRLALEDAGRVARLHASVEALRATVEASRATVERVRLVAEGNSPDPA
jgi:hypothetical protein